MNPFEIRTRLLELATEQLNRQYELNREFAQRAYQELVNTGREVQSEYQRYMPRVPTTEEITAQANKFYDFVKSK